MKALTTKTQFFVLLGYPLGHTVSPPMHNLAFDKLSMDCLYMPIEVTSEDLGTVFKGLSKMNVRGLNVTIPHKIDIMQYLDEIDPIAETIGAVNTIVIEDGKSKGFNTDGVGFIESLEEETGITIAGKRIFIVGSGGGARAIGMTLAFTGAEKIFISNRTGEKATALCSEINEKIRNCAEPVPMNLTEQSSAIKDCNILINTTSIGMHPNVDALPIDESLIRKDMLVADIVYNPRETKLLQKAKEKGCQTVVGLGMLLYQGVEAFKLWTGVTPPAQAMREKIEALMQAK